MTTRGAFSILVAVSLFSCSVDPISAQDSAMLKLSARIPLPRVRGRIDHLAADVKNHRLFVAALGNHTVEVIDLQSGGVVKTVPGLAEPQGVFYEPSGSRLFVASAGDGTTKVFDASTFNLLSTTAWGNDADNLRFDVQSKRVVVGYGEGALGILDLNGRKLAEIVLDAHPESFQLEKGGSRAFVNVPDGKEIQVVDLAKGSTAARWPVTSALRNYPMALDETHHRLFVGCRAPARLLVLDTGTGKTVASIEIVADTDDVFYDSARARIYVIGGGGSVDVYQQKDADHYEPAGRVNTVAGARTGLFVADWNQLFVAAPSRGDKGAEILVFKVP